VGETDEITLPRVHQRPRAIGHIHAEPAARRFPRVDTAALAGMAGNHVAAPIIVAVRASDSIVGAGAVAYLDSRPEIMPVPASRAADADVVLMLVDQVTEDVLAWMREAGRSAVGGMVRFVLVSDRVQAPQLLRAVACGVVSLLPRQGCDYEQIVQAIRHVRQGRVELPATALGALLESLRRDLASDDEDRPGGSGGTAVGSQAAGDLEERELDVLRLLAEGLGTAEIARRLNYSERTIKSIIHNMLNRMNLRNRSHAVAFALRNGLL
jgi:DNA-binding NarL/FixJ family response regulator